MSTPFSSFQNATLTFKVQGSEPVYGDYGHLVSDLQSFVVKAYLRQSARPQPSLFDGANQEDIFVEGRCISPLTLHPDIQPEVFADAVVNGASYKFRYQPAVASPFFAENQILGQKIEGYLIRTTTMGGDA